MAENYGTIKGLTDAEVLAARNQYGRNVLKQEERNEFIAAIKSLAKEPMVLLLLAAAVIYFVTGSIDDGLFLVAAIGLVSAISLFQDSRSRKALEQLNAYTQPKCRVIRNGAVQEIDSADLVVGDALLAEEGTLVAADGTILQSNDFTVNESILTGESGTVAKGNLQDEKNVYFGTTVTAGLAVVAITAIGNETKLGKIGKSLESIKEEKTPLELQINSFVKKMVIAGAVVFAIMWVLNFVRSGNALDSLLKALTLAMSILPEEIPVAFTSFMALGAWRLMKMGIVVKQMKTVETLGSATVICTDKTGTITENKMTLARLYVPATDKITAATDTLSTEEQNLVRMAMWASEPIPFDPMETALHDSYAANAETDERPNYNMAHEYPLSGKPPMMTHVFENGEGKRIIAAKGAPEALMAVAKLSEAERQKIIAAIATITAEGYRVLGVGSAEWAGATFPEQQQDLPFHFMGIVGFYDPPKKNIAEVLGKFYDAGINVKIVTGDNAATTLAIAQQIGLKGNDRQISGTELMELDDNALQQKVLDAQLFTRMFPEAKLRIINALKNQHQVVAMTGDGVNDGPALKAAHIGIAMGKKGTEIAKQAASLVLLDDDLSKMVDAVAMGRRIYTNLKKAIRYIISIHIPIILTVFLPLALGWVYPAIFSPVHIIFLELVMGPTCSIVFENEPMELNTMRQPPRPMNDTFFNWQELAVSILQGLAIAAGTLSVYQYAVHIGLNESQTRTMVFATMIAANTALTLVNRSFFYSLWATLKLKNRLIYLVLGITIGIVALLLYVPPLTRFFQFQRLTGLQLIVSMAVGSLSALWMEGVKWWKRARV